MEVLSPIMENTNDLTYEATATPMSTMNTIMNNFDDIETEVDVNKLSIQANSARQLQNMSFKVASAI
jgi:hypothetical protein